MNRNYVIVGDTEKYDDCLVCVAGSTYERAENVLNRMLNNPTKNDKLLMIGCKNLRIEFVENKDCWWDNDLD